MTRFDLGDEMFSPENKSYEGKTRKLYKARMEKLARSMFKWKCSEPNITGELIERYLWNDGMCIIWKHELLGWIVTKATEQAWNINGIPTLYRPIKEYEVEGVTFPDFISADDCVPIYEWSKHDIQRRYALFLANEIADINETIRTQVFNQKTPLLAVTGNEKTKQKLQNLVVNIAGNMKIMFLDSDLAQDVKALDFNAPFNVADLWSHKQSVFNDFLAWIGCDSQDAYQKKERKIVSEQEGNNEELNYVLADQLNERLKACDKAGELGITLTVEVQRSVRPADTLMDGDPEQPNDDQMRLDDYAVDG